VTPSPHSEQMNASTEDIPAEVFSALITSACAISDIAAWMSSTRTARIAAAPAAADHSNYTKQRLSHLYSPNSFGEPSCD